MRWNLPENENIIKQRIRDRLNLYPHYESILHKPDWYIKQQREYEKELAKDKLPYLIIETDILPDNGLLDKVLKWIGEK